MTSIAPPLAEINQSRMLSIQHRDTSNGFISNRHKSPAHELYQHSLRGALPAKALGKSKKALPTSEKVISDIRSKQSTPLNLCAKSLEGLSQPPGSKFLPSLLLWDNKGQDLYGDILDTKHYYPYRVENELLQQQVHNIGKKIASAGTEVLLELGAGNLQKTTHLLNAIDAHGIPLTYYALDVDHDQLETALSRLKARTNLQNVKLRGLLGTYEDGASWLSTAQEVRGKRKTVAWLGNSIANFSPGEASELLGAFTNPQAGEDVPSFVFGIDGCKDESLIECAYDTPGGQSRRWLKYALEAGKAQLGPEATELLDDDNWRFDGRWSPQNLRYETYLRAAIPMTCTIRDTRISIQRGERVYILGSGKWSKSEVASICSKQRLDIAQWWKSIEVDYAIYWLQPTRK